MKAITVQQPYAWALAHGGKPVENRGAGTAYRGPILIHASRTWSRVGGEDRRVLAAFRPFMWRHQRQDRIDPAEHHDRFPFGAIVAVAELTDVHPVADLPTPHGAAWCCEPWGEQWHFGPRGTRRAVHLILGDVQPLREPVPARGALGLWTPTAEVVDAVQHQLAEVPA